MTLQASLNPAHQAIVVSHQIWVVVQSWNAFALQVDVASNGDYKG